MKLKSPTANSRLATKHARPSAWRFLLLTLLFPAAATLGEDRVTYSTGPEDSGRATVTGTIVDYTGQRLVLRAVGGGEQPIPTSRVVSIQTTWPAQKLTADQMLAEQEYDDALNAYMEALRAEPRVWAQRQILTDCVRCLKQLGRIEQAGDAFLRLVQSDPETQDFGLIPLSWQAVQPASQLEQKALAWLPNTSPDTARLIGASWLLSTAHRAQAIETLRSLAARGEKRVASLAEAQLWRTRIAEADDAELRRWENLVEKMPAEIRCGAYFTIGQGLAARGQSERAAVALMRIPILYADDDRQLAAAALLSAARELEKIGNPVEAVSLYQEILRDYPQTTTASQASARLERLEAE